MLAGLSPPQNDRRLSSQFDPRPPQRDPERINKRGDYSKQAGVEVEPGSVERMMRMEVCNLPVGPPHRPL